MTHKYQALDATRREIRVLDFSIMSKTYRLWRGMQWMAHWSQPLECRSIHVSLDDKARASYETISYCWGDSTPCKTIIIDDATLQIPLNTDRALRRAILWHDSDRIWIDAICIDQKNTEERNQQVALMGHVYSGGTGNIVYLGEPDSMTTTAIMNIKTLLQEVCQDIDGLGDGGTLTDLLLGTNGKPMYQERSLHTRINESSLIELFAKPWFRCVRLGGLDERQCLCS